MENNAVWLGVIVVLAIGGIIAQWIMNMRNKRREKNAQ
jgi:hypothetical protein